MNRNTIGIANKDAGHLLFSTARLDDAVEGREELWRVELAGNAHGRGQVARSYEQDVDARAGRNGLDVLEGGQRFDLHDAQNRFVHLARAAFVGAELARAIVSGDAAVASRRIEEVSHGAGHLLGRVQPREHDPERAEVEDVANSNALG